MLAPFYSALLQSRIEPLSLPLIGHFILNYAPVLALDWEAEIVKLYGAPGLIFLALVALARLVWLRHVENQKRIAALSDTMIGSIKLKESEHGTALKDIVKAITDIVENSEQSVEFKRDILTKLAEIQSEQKRHRTFIIFLARVIPIKEERRKVLSEEEIGRILKMIREENP